MRPSSVRRSLIAVLVFPLLGITSNTPVLSAGPVAPPASPRRINTVPADVFGVAAKAPGVTIRREGGVTVERVDVPDELAARHQALPGSVFRVTVAGTFPPRAQRYVVLAGSRPVGYGVPSEDGRALVTVTRDDAVTERPIATAYGAGPAAASFDGAMPVLPASTAPHIDNPGVRGPLEVARRVYNLGDQAFQPKGLGAKVDLVGDVHYPADLGGGPYPLIVFMHGNHSTCYRGERSSYTWPCKQGWKPLPNYAGYDYIARKLAGWGYVVVSISANGVNYFGNWVDDTGMRQRGEVVEKHLDLWQQWSTVGAEPFGTTFVGAVDMSQIGTMGHSRGGEGVVWNVIVDRERTAPYGIDAVLALAPVDFTRVTINGVAFNVTLPYCDGDVSDLQGIHFFDDARYLVPTDQTPKSTVTVMGANHNYFNTVWSPKGGYPGSFDDGSWTRCANRLTEAQQRTAGAAYIVGFFRRYIGDEMDLDPMWTGEATPSISAKTIVSYHAPASRRLDLARFVAPTELARAQLGAVEPGDLGLYGWCSDDWRTPCVPGLWISVHMSFSWFTDETLPGLGQASLGWFAPNASLRFAIPSSRADVRSWDALQFRAAVNPAYPANEGTRYQDLSVVLEDTSGRRAEAVASDVGNDALAYPSSGRRGFGHYILNQVRFPIDTFTGVNLGSIRAVEIVLSRTPSGVVNVADVAFTRAG